MTFLNDNLAPMQGLSSSFAPPLEKEKDLRDEVVCGKAFQLYGLRLRKSYTTTFDNTASYDTLMLTALEPSLCFARFLHSLT